MNEDYPEVDTQLLLRVKADILGNVAISQYRMWHERQFTPDELEIETEILKMEKDFKKDA